MKKKMKPPALAAIDELSPLMQQMTWSHNICKRMATPDDWVRDPKTLLNDLRIIEEWRAELVTDNAVVVVPTLDELADPDFEVDIPSPYFCTVHRDKGLLFGNLFGIVEVMSGQIRAVQAIRSLPVRPDKLELFANTLEEIERGCDDQNIVIQLHHILHKEIRALEEFCRLKAVASSRLVTAKDVAAYLRIERTSLSPKEADWPEPAVVAKGNRPSQWRLSDLKPVLERQYPRDNWAEF